MPIAITLERDQAELVVAEACKSRQAAEIRFDQTDGPPVILSTALLALKAERIYVERPIGPDGPVEPPPGQAVHITFNAGSQRFGVDTAVQGSKVLQLDSETSADALELGRPKRVCELQRRAEFRVPLWSGDPVTAHFEPLYIGDAGEGALPEPFHATLQNISVGGVAALVSSSVRAYLAAGQHYMMDFFLPNCDDPFSFAVKVQHIRRLAHSHGRLIGLKFMPGDDSESWRRDIRQIRSFVDLHRRLKP